MRLKRSLLVAFLIGWPLVSHAGALHDAAKTGDTNAIAAELAAGADVNSSDGVASPLYYAVRRGHVAAAERLIQAGADVNARAKTGFPLKAAVDKGRLDLISLLLAHGADPNLQDKGETALHLASRRGCLECVKRLVEAGANVNVPTNGYEAQTPLHLAKLLGYREIADYLVAHGVVLPRPPAISSMLPAGDPANGAAYFASHCKRCHNTTNERRTGSELSLWNVVGRERASLAEMNYSSALKEWNGVWTYEDLNVFLYAPTLTTPGVLMEMPGIPDHKLRADVISYLRTLSDRPLPLP